MPKPAEVATWRLHKGVLDTFVLGIPAYRDGGSVYFTGTNAEANAEARRLDSISEPGVRYSVMGKEPAAGK